MTDKKPCCAKTCYKVSPRNLPLCCPMPGMTLWNGHPRVYLPIEATGYAVCPYCDAEYMLVDEGSEPSAPNEFFS